MFLINIKLVIYVYLRCLILNGLCRFDEFKEMILKYVIFNLGIFFI